MYSALSCLEERSKEYRCVESAYGMMLSNNIVPKFNFKNLMLFVSPVLLLARSASGLLF